MRGAAPLWVDYVMKRAVAVNPQADRTATGMSGDRNECPQT